MKVKFFTVVLWGGALFATISLSGCSSNSNVALNTAVALYMGNQAGPSMGISGDAMTDIFNGESSYYEVSKGPELLDNGNYRAVVSVSTLGFMEVIFSNDALCSVMTDGEAESCSEFLEVAGYSSARKAAAAVVKDQGLSSNMKVKLEYSTEDLGDGDVYTTLVNYREY